MHARLVVRAACAVARDAAYPVDEEETDVERSVAFRCTSSVTPSGRRIEPMRYVRAEPFGYAGTTTCLQRKSRESRHFVCVPPGRRVAPPGEPTSQEASEQKFEGIFCAASQLDPSRRASRTFAQTKREL